MLEVPDWGLASLSWFIYCYLSHVRCSNFCSLYWFWRCKDHPCPLSPHLGLWRMLEVPDWCLATFSWFGYCPLSYVPCSKFWPSILIWRCKEHPCPSSPDLWLWRMLEVPDWGLASSSGYGYGPWSLIHTPSKFRLFILIWRCKEHPCLLSPDLGFGGCWRFPNGVWHLDLDSEWSLVFDTCMFLILTLYLDFEGS